MLVSTILNQMFPQQISQFANADLASHIKLLEHGGRLMIMKFNYLYTICIAYRLIIFMEEPSGLKTNRQSKYYSECHEFVRRNSDKCFSYVHRKVVPCPYGVVSKWKPVHHRGFTSSTHPTSSVMFWRVYVVYIGDAVYYILIIIHL